jgi:hypothetical protein
MFFLIRVNQRCQNIQLIALSSILPGRVAANVEYDAIPF